MKEKTPLFFLYECQLLPITYVLLPIINHRDFSNMEAIEFVWFVMSVYAHLI